MSLASLGRSRQRTITVPAAKVGASESSVPVFFEMSDDADLATHARIDGRDVVFADDVGTVLDYEVGFDNVMERDWAWTWFTRPEAIYHNGNTYVAGHGFDAKSWRVGRYNHATSTWTTTTLESGLSDGDGAGSNDHNSPSLAVGSDGTIYVAASTHNGPSVFLFTSDAAESIASFTRSTVATGGEYTYPQIEAMGSTLFLSWRENKTGFRDREFVTSTNGGSTWSTAQTLVSGSPDRRPYMHQVAGTADRLDIAFTNDHPREIADGSNDIHHAYYLLSTGKFYETDGTEIGDAGTVSLDPSNATLVEDASTQGDNFWTGGIRYNGGNIEIVYTENRSEVDIRVRFARWSGTAWSSAEVAEQGETIYGPYAGANPEPQYTPGIALADTGEIWCSRDVGTGRLAIFEYERDQAAGTSWTGTQRSSGAGRQTIRPVPVRNADASLECFWLTGEFREYTDLTLDLCAYPAKGDLCDLKAIVKLDLDASTGATCNLLYGGTALTDQDLAGALGTPSLGVLGEVGRRFASGFDSDDLDGATSFVAIARASFDGDSSEEYIASDWFASAASSHFIMRRNPAPHNLGVFVRIENNTSVSVTASDLGVPGAASGESKRYGIAMRYDAGTLNAWIDGAKSSESSSGGTSLRVGGNAPSIRIGNSLHDTENEMIGGGIDFFLVDVATRSDNWLSLVTAAMGDTAFAAVGTASEVDLVAPTDAFVIRDVDGNQLALVAGDQREVQIAELGLGVGRHRITISRVLSSCESDARELIIEVLDAEAATIAMIDPTNVDARQLSDGAIEIRWLSIDASGFLVRPTTFEVADADDLSTILATIAGGVGLRRAELGGFADRELVQLAVRSSDGLISGGRGEWVFAPVLLADAAGPTPPSLYSGTSGSC